MFVTPVYVHQNLFFFPFPQYLTLKLEEGCTKTNIILEFKINNYNLTV